jgi:hypothetical protein
MRCCLPALLLLWLTLPVPACAWLTDTASHAPPACGVYGYEVFTPASPFFPAAGASYVDPIFGETFTRLTNIYPTNGGSGIIYGKNGLWNADSTAYLHDVPGAGVDLINPTTGALIRANVPYPYTTTDETAFDPVDPDIYYYTNGVNLSKYSISGNTSTTVKNFGATLGGLGQSVDWIDRTGRYFLLHIGANLRVWDKQTDTLYTGSIPFPAGVPPGWAGLSPDGNYVIVSLNPLHYSYAITHGTTTLNTTGVMFWDGCFDHGDVLTASDGFTYLFTANCRYGLSYYRVRVTNAVTADSSAQLTAPGNVEILPIGASGVAGNGHFSCAGRGAMEDWCYASIEDAADVLGSPGAWYAYKQEIVLAQMVPPYTVRRLAHHRNRLYTNRYCTTPRVNTNWSGDRLLFTSGMSSVDVGSCGYSDLYRWVAP